MYFFLENWRFTKFFSGNCFYFLAMAVENVLFLAVEQEQVRADAQRRNCSVGSVVAKKSSAVSRRNTVSLKQSRCGRKLKSQIHSWNSNP